MNKSWRVSPLSEQLISIPSLPPFVVNILQARGFKNEREIQDFFYPDYFNHIHSPFLFRDMRRVVDRIYQAIEEKEKIIVYGDYDADGVCSAALLVSTLKDLGANIFEVYIPHREREGYGLNIKAINRFLEAEATLLITLDCGTTNNAEVLVAKKGGMDVIVVDHHHVPDGSLEAFALLNAKISDEPYPFKDLASVGMAFKVSQALLSDKIKKSPEEREQWQNYEKWLLDFVAIATVTDLVSLEGENRALLKYGLIVLNKTRRPGLRALIKIMGEELGNLDTYHIGYQIGPRLNAAGRMDHARKAFNLLMCDNYEQALILAEQLNNSNKERRQLTEEITVEVNKELAQKNSDNVLVVVGNSWPVGLVGLVASRVVEQKNRPVLVISRTENGLVGSGRSIPGFNIIEALHTMPEFFIKFGGHAQACGFTLIDESVLPELQNKLNNIADQYLKADKLQPFLEIDATLSLKDIQWSLYDILGLFEPFGMSNPRPRFLLSNLHIVGLSIVGNNKQHLKLTLSDGQGSVRPAIAFGVKEPARRFKIGDLIDIVSEITVNEWRGSRELQLNVIDLRHSLL